MPRRNRLFLILLFGLISLTGCAGVGLLVGGQPETLVQNYTGSLKTWNPQIKNISKEVCKSLIGRINSMAENIAATGPEKTAKNVLQCDMGTDGMSLNVTYGTGKINSTKIGMRFDESLRRINYSVTTTANYGVNLEKENEQKMNELKTKLQEALKQEISLEKIE